MSKATRWAWIIALVAATGGGLVLFFLLSVATNNRLSYERHYTWLFWLNAVVAALLLLVIGFAALRLMLRMRAGKFGSRLLFKLAMIFALVGVAPGVLIYTVSYQFVSRSIESWFDVEVEGALDAGLNLGRGTLDAQVADLTDRARFAAERLGEAGPPVQPLALERLREQLAAQEVSIVDNNGRAVLVAGSQAGKLAPERPAPSVLRAARNGGVVSQLEGLDDEALGAGVGAGPGGAARIRVVAFIPSANFALRAQDHYLQVVQLLPPTLVANALAVQTAYREYQQRALAREGLRKMYIGTLTLALVLAVLGALVLAATLGQQLARPLLLLAEGVRQVAQGDLTRKQVFASRDELGGLTRSFADMTDQLSEARAMVQRSVAQLESARTHLQTILDNLTAGVIVFDRDGHIDTVNPGATRILRLPLSAHRGRRLDEVPGLEDFAQAIWKRFELYSASPEAGERGQWQEAFELQAAADQITLLVRGAALPDDSRLLVFDDITEVVSAQRSAAWSEVARRLAHEIKNPLTPIQLSAERLQHKLAARLDDADRAMLTRSVGTIVNQVQAMKQLVNEFRDYARLPAAQLVPLDLNALVNEVLGLYATPLETGRLRAQCEPRLPLLLGDSSQLRQVIHNLVQNALDAVAEHADGRVLVSTEAVRDEHGAPRMVRLKITDNGPGFTEQVLKRAFEPYVTTKSKGTGLGLAVVKKVADEHGARIRLANLGAGTATPAADDADRGGTEAPAGGAQVSLSFSKFAPEDDRAAAAAGAATPAH